MPNLSSTRLFPAVFVAASVSAFDVPTRQAILPSLALRERLADAMPLYMAMIQVTSIVEPTASGFVIAWLGPTTTYWIDAISYNVVTSLLLFMAIPCIQSVVFAMILLNFCG